jgi:hypothetical protein
MALYTFKTSGHGQVTQLWYAREREHSIIKDILTSWTTQSVLPALRTGL